MDTHTLFQYCQKLIVLSEDKTKVLLARRTDEADYNSTYSFIGGKLETSDASLIDGMKREKDEEIGASARIHIFPYETYNVLFRKKNGTSMVLPHIACLYISGSIQLNEEYSDYQWVPITELAAFEPKIENIPDLTQWAVRKLIQADVQLVEI